MCRSTVLNVTLKAKLPVHYFQMNLRLTFKGRDSGFRHDVSDCDLKWVKHGQLQPGINSWSMLKEESELHQPGPVTCGLPWQWYDDMRCVISVDGTGRESWFLKYPLYNFRFNSKERTSEWNPGWQMAMLAPEHSEGLTSKSLKLSRDGQSTDESMSPAGVLIRITMASVSMLCRLFKLTKSIKRKVDAS